MIAPEERADRLLAVFNKLTRGETNEKILCEDTNLIQNTIPEDVSLLVHRLVSLGIPMEEIKTGINRLMSVLRPAIENHPYRPPSSETYLGCMLENNRILDEKLCAIQPMLKELNDFPENKKNRIKLINAIQDLAKFRNYYEIKDTILFPEIRRHISKSGCLEVMTSYHAEIKVKLELVLDLLSSDNLNLVEFNKLTNELLLIMYELKFREERILYTIVQESVSESALNSLYTESLEIGFPYFQPDKAPGN